MHSLPEALVFAAVDERLREAERQRLITRAVAARRRQRRAAREARRERRALKQLPPHQVPANIVVQRHSS